MIDPKENELQLVNFRVPRWLLKAFDERYVSKDTTRAEVWRKILEEKVNAPGGQTQNPAIILEGLQEQRVKYLKRQQSLQKILTDTKVGYTINAYDALTELAFHLGTEESLVKDIDVVLGKLKKYQINPSIDHFRYSDKETFIEYIEAILQRREIEKQIEAIRSKES